MLFFVIYVSFLPFTSDFLCYWILLLTWLPSCHKWRYCLRPSDLFRGNKHRIVINTSYSQVQLIFLQYIPWFLRMSRPGEKITRKTIMMQKKMKEMEQKEISSKSLLANVLDIDDNFRSSTLPHGVSNHPSHVKPPLPNGCSVGLQYRVSQ